MDDLDVPSNRGEEGRGGRKSWNSRSAFEPANRQLFLLLEIALEPGRFIRLAFINLNREIVCAVGGNKFAVLVQWDGLQTPTDEDYICR